MSDENMPSIDAPAQPLISTKSLLRATVVTSLILGLGIAGATTLPIDGAIISEGRVLVEGKPQAVQSLDPGIVTRVAVRNGDFVQAGQLLLELDSATAKARLDIALERLSVALAEQARLEAEASGLNSIDFSPPALPFPAPDMGRAGLRQQALFVVRQRQFTEAQERLQQARDQIQAQMLSTQEQLEAALAESAFLQSDIDRQTDLLAQGLTRQTALSDLQREKASISGRIAQIQSEIGRLQGNQREAELAFTETQSRRAEEIAMGLRDRAAEVQQLLSEIMTLREALGRTQLRAPLDGIVHELNVPAAGSVISAGTALAQIMPAGRALEIEAEIDPADIDKIIEGQQAEIMLTAFDMRNTPRLQARVSYVPPDAVRRPETGQSYYPVTLTLDEADFPEDARLRAGMAAQVFVKTGSRSLLSWLVAPLSLPMATALREG